MRIAIIGAGVAGLSAARALRAWHPEWQLTIFEKGRGVGGRTATRRHAGCIYDHGAQYLKAPQNSALRHLIVDDLPRDSLRIIDRPVWTFDGSGAIAPGDPIYTTDTTWTYADGITALARLMVQTANLSVVLTTRVGYITGGHERRFALFDTQGQPLGEADAVLLAIPARQAHDLLAASALPLDAQTALLAALSTVPYSQCITALYAITPRPITPPYYALLNSDRTHPIAWAAHEHVKSPERAPTDTALYCIQMGRAFSTASFDLPAETLIEQIAEMAGNLLGQSLTAPLWTDLQRWRYALPLTTLDDSAVNGVLDGLFLTGDYLRGPRIHLAVDSGIAVGRMMADLPDR